MRGIYNENGAWALVFGSWSGNPWSSDNLHRLDVWGISRARVHLLGLNEPISHGNREWKQINR